MSDSIVYIDTSEIREGALEELKAAVNELVKFADVHESQPIAYNVYLSEGETRMSVVQVHPDSASLECHMEVAAPVFPKFIELVKLSSIDIYGKPSANLLKRLHRKAQMLGNGTVVVHELHAGFTRFAVH